MPAFPNGGFAAGLTLRDYFAGQAIVGRLADGTDRDYASVAEEAYFYADAMLAARELP
jgi:hypothetical protein